MESFLGILLLFVRVNSPILYLKLNFCLWTSFFTFLSPFFYFLSLSFCFFFFNFFAILLALGNLSAQVLYIRRFFRLRNAKAGFKVSEKIGSYIKDLILARVGLGPTRKLSNLESMMLLPSIGLKAPISNLNKNLPL